MEATIKSISDDRDSALGEKNASVRQLREQVADMQTRLRGKLADTDDSSDDSNGCDVDRDRLKAAPRSGGVITGGVIRPSICYSGGVIRPSRRKKKKTSDDGCTGATPQAIALASTATSPRKSTRSHSTSSLPRTEELSVFDSPFVSSLMAAEAMAALTSPAFIAKKSKDDDPFDMSVASPQILFSGVKSVSELSRLKNIASALRGSVVTQYSEQVTHCVCPANTFTEKTIICSANNRVWIVEPSWLTECHKAGRWIDEAPFGKRFPWPQYANSRIFVSDPESFPPQGKLKLLRQVMRVLSCVEITQFLPDVDFIVAADVAAAKLAFASFPQERIVSAEQLFYRLPFYLTKPPKTTAERKSATDEAAKRPVDEGWLELTMPDGRQPMTPVIAPSKRLRESTNNESKENGAVITPKRARNRRIDEMDEEESKEDAHAADEQAVAKPTRRLRSQDKHSATRRDYLVDGKVATMVGRCLEIRARIEQVTDSLMSCK